MCYFEKALPIWIANASETKNIRAIIRTEAKLTKNALLRIATSCVYSLYIDGVFVAYGPARAGKNHFRMDEISLEEFVSDKIQLVTIEVQSYQVNSFCLMKQSPFLQAELVSSEEICAYTGGSDFSAGIDDSLVQKIQRFSFQRPFVEGYRLTPNSYEYRTNSQIVLDEKIEVLDEKCIVNRHSQYPIYETRDARLVFSGIAEKKSDVTYVDSRSYTMISDKLEGFPPEELEWHVSRELQEYAFCKAEDVKAELWDGEYSIYDFGVNYAGFLRVNVTASKKTILYAVFDEVLVNNDVDIIRDECCRAVKYELEPGTYELKFFEPYCMKYVKLFVSSGSCVVQGVSIIGYNHPPVDNPILSQNAEIKLLSETAINTFRGNAVDLLTDCPSRERGGYPCDSFFTARTEYLLTGKNHVEKDFLENFLHEDKYSCIEPRMIPMCYPADHWDGVYIANWGLWLILELKDYLRRTGDCDLVERYRDKVMKLVDFHRSLENQEYLLTKIPEGVFVEWSHANEMVQDINFPSNMLWYAALHVVAELYGNSELLQHGEQVKQSILKYAYVDGFFCDHAKYENDRVMTIKESSEVCQYYAFLFGIADENSHSEWFEKMVNEFGPKRREENTYPDICFAELFMGIPLRIEMLLQKGLFEVAYEEIKFFYLKQAELIGTFWEAFAPGNSYNHGLGSIVLYWLDKIEKQEKSFLW